MSDKPLSSRPLSPKAGVKRRDLTRGTLVAAAIGLLDAGGVSALSIRSVADAVGVTPMAIYNHFESKRELLVAVADEIIGSTNFDGGHENWRRQIHYCFTSLRHLCLRHPALPLLLEHCGEMPSSASAPMKVTLEALASAGMSELNAMRTYYLLLGFTLSQSAYQSQPIPKHDTSQATGNTKAGGAKTFEATWDYEESFQFGLGIVLDGISASQRSLE